MTSWATAIFTCILAQGFDPTRVQSFPGQETLSFAWTTAVYDAPDAPWAKLREAGERISASGKGATFRAEAERQFAKKPPTTGQAFQYAVVALNDRLTSSLGSYGLTDALAPARLYLNRAPLVRAPEIARIQIMLNSLIEDRPEVIARYGGIVRRFATLYPNDLNLRYRGAMLLVMSGASKDQSWSVEEAERLLQRWPKAPETHHVAMHSTFARWTRARTIKNRAEAIVAAQGYEKVLVAMHQNPSQPRDVLRVLKRRP